MQTLLHLTHLHVVIQVHSPLEVPQAYLQRFPHLKGNAKIRNGMVAAMDDQIGQVVQALNETNQLDNTIIVFTADNVR